MTVAAIFPGQGSQTVGMGLELADKYGDAAYIWDSINGVLGRPLTTIIAQGPQDVLNDTANAQPAIFAVNYMYWKLLRANDLNPGFLAGHSLGELSAYSAAGIFSFDVGLKMVAERAKLMARAAAERRGGMLAVLGLDSRHVELACESLDFDVANYNSPGQTVAAGPAAGIEAAEAAFMDAGAKRVVKLPVSGPFHTSLMVDAADRFREFLASVEFADPDPDVVVVTNVTGERVVRADQAKSFLVEQMKSPVRWMACIEFLIDQGVSEFVETGPGKVLSGLVKNISAGVLVDHALERLTVDEMVDKP